jgi:hypothetical protein
MKTIVLSILLGLLLLSFNSIALATDVTITGAAHFKCSLMSKYMQKHGYSFIGVISAEEYLKVNRYAARDAQVIIKDKNNITVGKGQTDKDGNFSITVPQDDRYQVIVKFHDHEVKEDVSLSNLKNFIIDLGNFSSESVGSWIDARYELRK